MKALLLEQGEVHVRDIDDPEPAPDQARVHLTASGVCHSDLHLARGDWAGLPNSMPLGHEGIGVVEALGPGAERFVSLGDRVILGLGGTGGGYWCGACEYCLSGQPRHCRQAKGVMGRGAAACRGSATPRHCRQAKGVMGTFAEQFAVYAPGLVALPDGVPDS